MGDFSLGEFFIESEALLACVGLPDAEPIFDVRRRKAFDADPGVVPTARWRDHRAVADWAKEIPSGATVVVYCVHGEQVSQSAAAALRSRGIRARALAGGIEAWRDAGGPLVSRPAAPEGTALDAGRWVLPLDPSIAVLAQAWFLRRFVDPRAAFFFVAADQVEAAAAELDALPLAVADRAGQESGQEDLMSRLASDIAPLQEFARILAALERGDAEALPEARGFRMLVEGSQLLPGDAGHRLERGLAQCDALYAWLRARSSGLGGGT